MAGFTAKLPSDLINKLDTLEKDIGNIEDEMLNAATKILEPEVSKNLQQSITGQYDIGNLAKSVSRKITRSKKEAVGVVYFKGTSTRVYKNGKSVKVRNGLKAAVLEYGRKGQPARPFLRPAMNAKKEEIFDTMEKIFENETKKYT